MTLLLILLATLPPIGLVIYFYLRDRYEPEPRGYVVAAFLYGLLVLVPALYVGPWVKGLVEPEWLLLSGMAGRLYEDFLVASAVEEGLKWLIFVSTILRWREFDEPMDGVVYGATMALGLAAVENLHYVLVCQARVGCDALGLALLRGVFSVPAHALFGASMGFFLGRAKFVHHRWRLGYLVPASLLVPWVFHGFYDHFCGYVGSVGGWFILGAASLAMWAFVLFAITWALGRSPFRPAEAGKITPDDPGKVTPDDPGKVDDPAEGGPNGDARG